MATQSLYDIISGLSLTSGLKLCLDAGDSNSYDPAVDPQKWLDTSGNGFNWFVGNDGTADATDPTFNGTPGGLSSNEYFNVGNNGTTRRFNYESATAETWMSNLCKDNAVYTLLAVWKPQLSGVFQTVFNFGYGTGAAQRGMVVVQTSSETLELRIYDSVANSVELSISAASQEINGWNILLISWNEAGNYAWRNNANTGSGNAAYTRFGTFTGQAALFSSLPANTLAACAAIWEGVALSSTELTNIYSEISQRFGNIADASIAQADNTISADGTVTSGVSSVTADANINQDNNSVSADLSVLALANANITQAGDTLSASIGEAIRSTGYSFNSKLYNDHVINGNPVALLDANITQAGDSVTAAGVVPAMITCDANITQNNQTVSASASVSITASASITQAGNTVSAAAANAVLANATITQAGNTVSSASKLIVTANAVIAQSDNTVDSQAVIYTIAVANIQAGDDSVSSYIKLGILNRPDLGLITPHDSAANLNPRDSSSNLSIRSPLSTLTNRQATSTIEERPLRSNS